MLTLMLVLQLRRWGQQQMVRMAFRDLHRGTCGAAHTPNIMRLALLHCTAGGLLLLQLLQLAVGAQAGGAASTAPAPAQQQAAAGPLDRQFGFFYFVRWAWCRAARRREGGRHLLGCAHFVVPHSVLLLLLACRQWPGTFCSSHACPLLHHRKRCARGGAAALRSAHRPARHAGPVPRSQAHALPRAMLMQHLQVQVHHPRPVAELQRGRLAGVLRQEQAV